MVEDIVRKNGFLAFGSRFRRIGERMQADVQALIDEHDLPLLAHQFPLLFALDDNGPLEIGQLARALGVSQPGVTRSVAQLETAACVTVVVDPSDRRVRKVDLADEGRRIMQIGRGKIAPRVLGAFDRILGEDGTQLLELIDRLEDALAGATLAELSTDIETENGDG